jgi:hypothetical protein
MEQEAEETRKEGGEREERVREGGRGNYNFSSTQ